MEIIIHRVNKIKFLKSIPKNFGVEIDVRSFNSELILNHEPKKNGDKLSNFLKNYQNGTIIFNIKEAGIEKDVITMAKKYKVKSFFLLDVEHPFIFTSKGNLKNNLSSRFSEFEPLELTNNLRRFVKWVWIDTVNKLPLNNKNLVYLKKYKTCLVSPERWNRKKDIKNYINFFKKNKYFPNAVMTDMICANIWTNNL